MDDALKDRLDDAVDDMLERNREAMRQHGELGGTANKDEMAPDESDDPLESDPEQIELAIDRLRQRAVERALEDEPRSDDEPEIAHG